MMKKDKSILKEKVIANDNVSSNLKDDNLDNFKKKNKIISIVITILFVAVIAGFIAFAISNGNSKTIEPITDDTTSSTTEAWTEDIARENDTTVSVSSNVRQDSDVVTVSKRISDSNKTNKIGER